MTETEQQPGTAGGPPAVSVRRNGAAAVETDSIVPAVAPRVGVAPGRGAPRRRPAPPTFLDVDSRAHRLLAWAAEESAYVRSHDVLLFSRQDVDGRTRFADEGLYELLPRLNEDAARLRYSCGPGPLTQATLALCERASAAVQDYYLLWQQMREQIGSR